MDTDAWVAERLSVKVLERHSATLESVLLVLCCHLRLLWHWKWPAE